MDFEIIMSVGLAETEQGIENESDEQIRCWNARDLI